MTQPMPPEKRGTMRTITPWLAIAAAQLVLGVVGSRNSAAIDALLHLPHTELTEPIGPTLQLAATLREEASAECARDALDACRAKLEEAKQLDPAGDEQPQVKAMWAQIASKRSP
jgi:hypothetical protein